VFAQATALAGLLEGVRANEQRPHEQRRAIRHAVDAMPVRITSSPIQKAQRP